MIVEQIIITLLFSPLAITIVLGNLSALTVIYSIESLQNAAGYALANLAAADALTSISLIGSIVIYNIDNIEMIDPVVCKFLAFMMYYPFGVVLFTTTWITFDRCFAIFIPFTYRRWVTTRNVTCLFIITWLLLFVWCIIPSLSLGYGFGNYQYISTIHTCWVNVTDHEENGIFLLVSYSIVLALVVTVVVCYTTLLYKARRVMRTIRCFTNDGINGCSLSPPTHNRKSYRTTLIVVGASLMCILPAVILIYVTVITTYPIKPPIIYNIFCFWTFYINAAINPFIFGFSHKAFRDGYQKLFKKFRRKLYRKFRMKPTRIVNVRSSNTTSTNCRTNPNSIANESSTVIALVNNVE